MKREDISEAVGNISTKYIQEAAPNIREEKDGMGEMGSSCSSFLFLFYDCFCKQFVFLPIRR
jgi:hypothetical protein